MIPDQTICVTQIRLTFSDLSEKIYQSIKIDATKCLSYREQTKKDNHCVKSIAIELAKN